jgi:uncharacterized membrane protein
MPILTFTPAPETSMTFLAQYLSVLVVLAVVDGIWLGVVARRFYQSAMGHLMRDDILWLPALAFYLIYGLGLTLLAVAPAARGGDWATAAGFGALVGLTAYGTYNLTNLATMRGFPWSVALVDLTWGTVLSAVTATLGLWIARWFTG